MPKILSTHKTLYLVSMLALLLGCTRENQDVTKLYDLLYVSRNGADIPAHIHGNAASDVFIINLHGGPGGYGLEYRTHTYITALEKEYAVVYTDQRGQGMSQGHLKDAQATLEEMTKDIRALAWTIRAKYGRDVSLFLMGHSWGGTLGTAYVSSDDFQKEFDGWIEVSGAHSMLYMAREQIEMIKTLGVEQMAANHSVSFWENAIKKVSAIDTAQLNADKVLELNELGNEAESRLINDLFEKKQEANIQDLKNALFLTNPLTGLFTNFATANGLLEDGLFTLDLAPKMSSITIPTLIIYGRYDVVVPPALGAQALDLISATHKTLHIYEKSGHSPMVDEADRFAADIIDFIEQFK